MDQYVDGHPPYWIKGVEEPHSVRRGEPKYVLALTDNHECLQRKKIFIHINVLNLIKLFCSTYALK